MADETTLRVLRPDGKYSRIPLTSWAMAKARGYQLAGNAPAQPAAPAMPDEGFLGRAGARVGEDIKGAVNFVPEFIKAASTRGQEAAAKGDVMSQLTAIPSAARDTTLDLIKSLYSVSTLGIIGRIRSKEDPATIAADLAMAMTPGEEGAKVAAKGIEKSLSPIRIAGQEIAGAGREPVLQEVLRRREQATKAVQSYNESAEAVARDNAQKMKEHNDKVAAAKAEYDKAVTEHQAAVAEKRAGHQAKVEAARREWVQKSYEAKRAQAEHNAAQSKLQTLTRGQQAYADVIKRNVTDTFNRVKASLDKRWNDLRDTVVDPTRGLTLEKVPLNSIRLAESVEKGRAMLQGAPADLKVFNDLMRQMETTDTIDEAGGGTPALRPLGWQEGRVHYSALGDKLYSGELPGNVARAVREVRSAIDSQLQEKAAQYGKGREYAQLKSDWSRFEDDWKDRSSIATGGSPLARVLDAKDPGFVIQQATGKAADRMANTLGRYSKFGGNPLAVTRLRALAEEVKKVPRIRVPEAPSKFTPPKEPEMPSPPEGKVLPTRPEMRAAKPPRMPEPVSPVDIRRRELLEMAGRPFRWYDLFPPYLIEHLLVKSPAFREWLATQPRRELRP